MGIFDDLQNNPTAMALLGMGSSMATPATRVPVSPLYSANQAFGAVVPALMQQQQLKAGNMGNQIQQMNLQRQQAMQPMIMNQIKGMGQGGAFGAATPSGATQMNPYFQQALSSAYMSGDMNKVSAVLQSIAEHDPSLAGAKTTAEQRATLRQLPNGQWTTGAAIMDGQGQSDSANPAPPAASGRTSVSQGTGNPVTDLFDSDWKTPPQAAQPSGADTPIKASDGKAVLPGMTNLFKPDPSGTPAYKTDNTETGVNQTKLFQADDTKSNAAFSANAASLQNEQFRLKELTDVYKQVQSGTLTAQNPELANKLIAWGVIKDPKEVSNVAGIQNALQSHALQIIQQIKDTNANFGGAPTRTFGSEISNLQEQGENPGAQPEALWNIIGQARGLVEHNLDMVKGWDAIGGLGNRQANGYTLRPDDYARKFIESHDITDYKKAAQQDMGPFKGMANPGAPVIIRYDATGKRVQ